LLLHSGQTRPILGAGPVVQSQSYDSFWSRFFGVPESDMRTAGFSVVSHVGLSGYRGVWF